MVGHVFDGGFVLCGLWIVFWLVGLFFVVFFWGFLKLKITLRTCQFRERSDSFLLMRIFLILYSACLDFIPLLSRFCLCKPSDIHPMKWCASFCGQLCGCCLGGF